MKNLKLKEMILISIFAALTAIGAFLKIETPLVPFTLQFVFCAYAGLILGSRKGLYSQILYVLIGLVGFPIFAHGGGPMYIFKPTFGYLIGFIVCAFVIGKMTENIEEYVSVKSFIKIFASVLTGLFFVYLFGVSYLYLIVNVYLGKAMSVQGAIAAGFLPYILSDVILSFLVAFSSIKVLSVLKKGNYIGENNEAEYIGSTN